MEWLLRLDSFGVAEYLGFNGIGSSVIHSCLGREFHNLGCGVPLLGSQPTLTTPASKRRRHTH